ncbi:hypothetical protein FQA39_LY00684 [Lamprigera yunnana]|nr:hypothetical protein FQA39_LY00684 [Lamprigera yunnana]
MKGHDLSSSMEETLDEDCFRNELDNDPLTTCDMSKPRKIGSKPLMFEMIEEKKILRIEDMCGNEVYLGWESVSEVWSLETVRSNRLSYFSASSFKHLYNDVIRAVAEMSRDANANIYNIVNRLPEKYDNVRGPLLYVGKKHYLMYNLKYVFKNKKYSLLKKMWMLYAEQDWTKAIDLISAVEHLYDKLGALEFDADHEAIYDMKKYYTVEQCEQLQDKYKIGKKCLKDRLSKIGLQHFLDTINKYICNSNTYDKKEYKAVEQYGERSETTKEEE